MNKKNEKVAKNVEPKDTKKVEVKKASSFKKKKEDKKKYYIWYCIRLFNF